MLESAPILLAEDNPLDAELTLRAFSEVGMSERVVHVVDGVEVLLYLRREGRFAVRSPELPAVVILDLKMPRLDGLGTLRAIRSDAVLRLLPVVILTSSREHVDLLRSYELGANAYVVKPVRFAEFMPAIQSIADFWCVLNEAPPI